MKSLSLPLNSLVGKPWQVGVISGTLMRESSIDTLKKVSTWSAHFPSPFVAQVFPAARVGGLSHVAWAGVGMAMALKNDSLSFKQPSLEWLGRVAGELHLQKAQARVGLSNSDSEVVWGFLFAKPLTLEKIQSSLQKEFAFKPTEVTFASSLSTPKTFSLSPESFAIEHAALAELGE